jgi:class 3 adenylate cyclase
MSATASSGLMAQQPNPKDVKISHIKAQFSQKRLAVLATICVISLASLLNSHSTIGYQILGGSVLYYLLSSVWFYIQNKNSLKSYRDELETIDLLVHGAVLSASVYCFVISGAILLAVLLGTSTRYSAYRLIVNTIAFLTTSLAITMWLEPNWTMTATAEEAVALFIGLLVYVLMFGKEFRQTVEKATQHSEKLTKTLVTHKMRTYKLSRYVSPTVWNLLNQGKENSLKTERKRVTIFFSDIEGFSQLSEEMEAETLSELLNSYLTEMVKIITRYRGTIDKFMGDGIMVIFGDHESEGVKADCLRCVSMAIEMRKKMKELESKWFHQGIKRPLKIRMGINSGYVTVGTFGTSEYMDYTVLGTHVNLASRLESAAQANEILVSHETWSFIKDVVMCRDRGEVQVKGFSHPIKVYQVLDLRKNLGKNQSYFEEHLQGFSMHLDLDKVKNYDKDRIIEQLENLADKVRDDK